MKLDVNKIWLSFVLLLIPAISVFGKQQITDMRIASESRAFIYFLNYPVIYKSELSEDKRKVIIKTTNTSVADTARNRQGSAVITELYAQSENKDINVFISLDRAMGYTAVPLPYSRAIMVDLFEWSKLSPSEDTFRTALLAYEDNILEAAKIDLLASAKQGIAEAAMFLGIIHLKEGKTNSALKNLEYAHHKGVDIPDLYAAMSQAYSLKNLQEQSNLFADKFKKTANKSFSPRLPIDSIVEPEDEILEPVEHLTVKLEPEEPDTSAIANADDRFSTIFDESETKQKDIIPGIYNEILTIFAGILVAIILLVVLLYLRWKNKQIRIRQNVDKKPKEQRTAKPKAKPDASAKDSKQSNAASKLMASRAYNQSAPAKDTSKVSKEGKSDTDKSTKSETKSIEDLMQTIRAVAEKKVLEEKEDKESVDIEEPKSTKKLPAKLEIAMNLAEEQRRIKQINIDSLGKTIMINHSNLTETAKKLGIEKGSIETRKAIENIETDSDKLKKLQEKFKS